MDPPTVSRPEPDSSPSPTLEIVQGSSAGNVSGASPLISLATFMGATILENRTFTPVSMAPLSIKLDLAAGERIYVSARPPEGCEFEDNGTFVNFSNVTYRTTVADCEEDPAAEVGLWTFGDDTYLLRPTLESAADKLRFPCSNISGYEGPPPPLVFGATVFKNTVHCPPPPSIAPTEEADPGLPAATPRWLQAVPKIGAVAAALAGLGACVYAINRRAQAGQVRPAAEAEGGAEMVRLGGPTPAIEHATLD